MVSAVILGGVVLANDVPAASSTAARPDRTPILRVKWRLVANVGSAGVVGNGRFVFALFNNGFRHAVLIDDQTGKRSAITIPPGCFAKGMGGVWLLFRCGSGNPPQVRLYRVSIPGYWRTLAPSPEIVRECGPPPPYARCDPTAVGSHWVAYSLVPCQTTLHCDNTTSELQNIDTGRVIADPTARDVITDLNASVPARRLCSPVRVPLDGRVTFYAQFAVTFGLDPTGDALQTYLKKCGSPLNRLLQVNGNFPPAGNRQAIVWAEFAQDGITPRSLQTVLLPSLRRRVIKLPTELGPISALVFGPHHLYVAAAGLYTVTSPALTGAASGS
jgi:hypothetical protein